MGEVEVVCDVLLVRQLQVLHLGSLLRSLGIIVSLGGKGEGGGGVRSHGYQPLDFEERVGGRASNFDSRFMRRKLLPEQ